MFQGDEIFFQVPFTLNPSLGFEREVVGKIWFVLLYEHFKFSESVLLL